MLHGEMEWLLEELMVPEGERGVTLGWCWDCWTQTADLLA